jgi:hypothetical protein
MIKKILKLTIFLPLAALLLYGGVRGGLNYSGYCWEQKRWLSDEELIEAGANAIVTHYPDAKDYPEFASDPMGYIKAHPDCCFVGDKYTKAMDNFSYGKNVHDEDLVVVPGFFNKTLGSYRSYVTILIEDKKMFVVNVKRCGGYWHY